MDYNKLLDFLTEVDTLFPVPLSKKQNLEQYAKKLTEHGYICAEEKEGKIISLAAGYLNRDPGYLSIAATIPEEQGKGLGKKLVVGFLDEAKKRGISSVHLYAVPSNKPAMKMHKDIGFVPWDIENEPRPSDAHLIYRIRTAGKACQ